MNVLHASVIFVNNYGRHDHSFKAAPTQFLWDWQGLAAHVAGAGCITINGVYMAWSRWTPLGNDVVAPLFERALGADAVAGSYQQLTTFKETTPNGIEPERAAQPASDTAPLKLHISRTASGDAKVPAGSDTPSSVALSAPQTAQ